MAELRPASPPRLARLRRLGADGCHVLLSVALWAGGILLASLGLVLALVLLATGLDLERLFAHLQNLSSHYLLAEPAVRARFDRQLVGVFAGLVALLVVARAPAFLQRLRRELGQGGRHG